MRTLIVGVALLLAAAPVEAQKSFNSGFNLHGNFHFNRSTVQTVGDVRQAEHGYGVGLELSGRNLAGGLYGFAVGRPRAYDTAETAVHAVLEGNYYIPIESLRLAPFAGVHTGLGSFTSGYFDDPFLPRPQDGLGDIGFQFGVRFQPLQNLGVEAQWRQHAESVFVSAESERRQVLLGVVLF